MTQHTLDGSQEGQPPPRDAQGDATQSQAVTRKELIEHLKTHHPDLAEGVTPTTIGNWEKAGTLTPLNPDEKPRRYSLDLAIAQARRHVTTAKRGGKRKGAGRPKNEPDAPLGREIEKAQTRKRILEDAKARQDSGERPDGSIDPDDLLTITQHELDVLVSVMDEVYLTSRHIETQNRLLENRRRKRLEDEAEGKLVEAEAMQRVVRARFAALRNAIDSMMATLADDAIQIARGEPTRRGELFRAMQGKVSDLFAEFGGEIET